MIKKLIKTEDFWFKTIIIFFLFIRLILFFYNFTAPPVDTYCSRQAHVLMVARNFNIEGINLLMSKVDIFGKPGYCNLEFPVYEALIAIFCKIINQPIIIGRTLNIIFTILSSIFLYLIISKIIDKKTAIFSVLFFLFAPLMLYFSRTIIIEPMEIFLLLLLTFLYQKWIDKKNIFIWWFATILGILFAIIKPQYTVILVSFVFAYRYTRNNKLKDLIDFDLILSFFIQAIFTMIWLHHILLIDKLFPNTFSVGQNLQSWFLGNLELRLNPNVYLLIFIKLLTFVVARSGILIFMVALWQWKDVPKLIKLWLGGIILYICIFLNTNFVHENYHLITIPVFSIFMAFGFQKILGLIKEKRLLFVFFALFMIFYSNVDDAKPFFELREKYLIAAEIVKKYVPPRSMVAYCALKEEEIGSECSYHYNCNTTGINIDLSGKRLTKEDISRINKIKEIDYFVLIGPIPDEIFKEFKELKLLYNKRGKLTIFKIK